MNQFKVGEKIVGCIFAFSFFFSSLPYYVWHAPYLRYFFELLSLFLIFKKAIFILTKDSFLILIFFFCVLLYISRESSFGGTISLLLLPLILLMDKKYCLIYLEYFRIFISVYFLISLTVYFLVIWLGIDIPYYIVQALNSLKVDDYRAYPFCVIQNSEYGFINYRFMGPFDEPGVVGTLSIILLYGEKYNLRKKLNIVLLLAGVFSFSFFFFVMTLFYLLFFSYKRKYALLCVTIISLSLLGLFKDDEVAKKLVFDRFSFTDNGEVGGNRSGVYFDKIYDQYLFTTESLLGAGGEKTTLLLSQTGASTYKSLIYCYGLIGFGIILLFWMLVAFKNIKETRWQYCFIILILCTVYQRPSLFEISYFFLFFSITEKFNKNVSISNSHRFNV